MLYQISRDRCKDIEIVSPQKKEHFNVRDYKFREDAEREIRIDAKNLELKEREELAKKSKIDMINAMGKLLIDFIKSQNR